MRKYEALMHLRKLGLNVGELKEFEYSEIRELYEYAKHLLKETGGLIVRTDWPKSGEYKKPIGLPFMSPVKDLETLKAFVEKYKEKYTYILFEMCDYSRVILSAYVYLDDMQRLCGEINEVDKINMRDAMTISKNLKSVCIGPGGSSDPRLGRIRMELIKAGIAPNIIVELSIFDLNGRIIPVYKQLRGEGF